MTATSSIYTEAIFVKCTEAAPSDWAGEVRGGYHGLDALWEEEAVVQRVHGVVGLHVALPLQQDGPGVQSVVGPEHAEAGFLIALDQRPAEGGKHRTE